MTGCPMSGEATALKEQLVERGWTLGVHGDGKRLNAVARVLELNAYTNLRDLGFAEPPRTWIGQARLWDSDCKFLESIIEKERLKVPYSR